MTEGLRVFRTLPELRSTLAAERGRQRRIALVPTMGNLHRGHLALVEAAREHADLVIATIFVNPLQFGPGEDYARYPRSFDADCQALDSASCDGVFVPSVEEMYPDGLDAHTTVSVPELSALHCGASRPGHFDGVCTVVCKLFNMVQPDLAIFGLKDYQQFCIISKLVRDLCLPIELLGLPTVREESGLALSSRNAYLDDAERNSALAISRTLQELAQRIRNGDTEYRLLEQQACEAMELAGLRPDYCHICRRDDLRSADAGDGPLVILAAAFAGSTRLIDNLQV